MHGPTRFIHLPTHTSTWKKCDALHQRCFWQTRKYQSLVEFTLLLHIHGLNLKGHMTDGYLRTMTLYGPCHVQLVTAVLNMLTLSSCIKMTSLTDKGWLLFTKKKIQSALINFCFVLKLPYWEGLSVNSSYNYFFQTPALFTFRTMPTS